MKHKRLAVGILLCSLSCKVFADSTYISSQKNLKTNNQIEANKLWQKFISCGDQKNTQKFATQCLKDTLSKSLTIAEISKTYDFLSLGLEINDLVDCSNEEKKNVINPKKNNFLCFKILGNKSELTGYSYFERENGILKIKKLKY